MFRVVQGAGKKKTSVMRCLCQTEKQKGNGVTKSILTRGEILINGALKKVWDQYLFTEYSFVCLIQFVRPPFLQTN